jgi:outer membrane lipoprotein-sorting protein
VPILRPAISATLPKTAILVLILLCLSACATVQKPLVGLVPGREVETLQSSIAISMKAGEHGSSGRGYLLFKYPDRFHMAVLSPFGLTVLEVFSDGERLTCLVPSRQTAYSGLIADLPESGGLRTFSRLKWVVARTPKPDATASAREVTTASGDRIYFDTFGLVQRKVSLAGDEASYADYHNVNGVAFPNTLEIKNSYGDTIRIVFDDPEINGPVENSALEPNLTGLNVLPLAMFKGI